MSSPEATSELEAKRSRQILEAAAKLMQRRGSHGVSMKEIAEQAGLSVGLIYRYYANKEELVNAVVVELLSKIAYEVPLSSQEVGDPVHRLITAFKTYASIIRDRRHALMLAYRETKILEPAAQERLKQLELETVEPMLEATQAAIDEGIFRDINAEVYAYNMLLAAHSWALKYWYYAPRFSFDEFVAIQLSQSLGTALRPEYCDRYHEYLGK